MEGEVETAFSVFDLDFCWKGGWERWMTEGGSVTTESGEVMVHDDVGEWRRRGVLSVPKILCICMRARRTALSNHAQNGCGCNAGW